MRTAGMAVIQAERSRLAPPPPLAGQVVSHRRCDPGEGFLLWGSLPSGDTLFPTLPRIRLRPKAGFGGQERRRERSADVAAPWTSQAIVLPRRGEVKPRPSIQLISSRSGISRVTTEEPRPEGRPGGAFWSGRSARTSACAAPGLFVQAIVLTSS